MDVAIVVVGDPRMIDGRVIRHEVEHQAEAALGQPLAEPGQPGLAADGLVDRVRGDGEPGPADVLLAQVGQRRLEFAAQAGIGPRDRSPGLPGLPHAE